MFLSPIGGRGGAVDTVPSAFFDTARLAGRVTLKASGTVSTALQEVYWFAHVVPAFAHTPDGRPRGTAEDIAEAADAYEQALRGAVVATLAVEGATATEQLDDAAIRIARLESIQTHPPHFGQPPDSKAESATSSIDLFTKDRDRVEAVLRRRLALRFPAPDIERLLLAARHPPPGAEPGSPYAESSGVGREGPIAGHAAARAAVETVAGRRMSAAEKVRLVEDLGHLTNLDAAVKRMAKASAAAAAEQAAMAAWAAELLERRRRLTAAVEREAAWSAEIAAWGETEHGVDGRRLVGALRGMSARGSGPAAARAAALAATDPTAMALPLSATSRDPTATRSAAKRAPLSESTDTQRARFFGSYLLAVENIRVREADVEDHLAARPSGRCPPVAADILREHLAYLEALRAAAETRLAAAGLVSKRPAAPAADVAAEGLLETAGPRPGAQPQPAKPSARTVGQPPGKPASGAQTRPGPRRDQPRRDKGRGYERD